MSENEKCLIDPERDCFGLIKATELEKQFNDFRGHNEKCHKEYYDRLAAIERHNEIQDVHYTHITEKLTEITTRLADLATRIASIEIKPAKKYDGMVEKALTALIGGLVAYFLFKMGLNK